MLLNYYATNKVRDLDRVAGNNSFTWSRLNILKRYKKLKKKKKILLKRRRWKVKKRKILILNIQNYCMGFQSQIYKNSDIIFIFKNIELICYNHSTWLRPYIIIIIKYDCSNTFNFNRPIKNNISSSPSIKNQ